jgi:hypothetical protein
MHKMEITNYGRELALTIGLANMHVCVFCWNYWKIMCWNWWFQCVCPARNCWKSICWNWWFQCVCVLLELSDSWYVGIVTACEVCVHAKMCRLQRISIRCRNWVVCSELTFAVELCVLQRNYDSLPKLSRLQRMNIRCRIGCSAEKMWFAAKTVSAAAN